MGQAADTYLRHPYAYTSFEMARSPIDYADLDGGTNVRIFSHTFLKKQIFQKFLGSFPRAPGLDARISRLLSSRHLPLDFFPPPPELKKFLLRHSQPPTSPLRQHHVRIRLVALRTPGFFQHLYLHFNNFN